MDDTHYKAVRVASSTFDMDVYRLACTRNGLFYYLAGLIEFFLSFGIIKCFLFALQTRCGTIT